jgi:hypothetical protein
MAWIDWIKVFVRDDRFDLPTHDAMMVVINAKKEAVIARVMQTGVPCYKLGEGHHLHCSLCDTGPCRGPIEKFGDL